MASTLDDKEGTVDPLESVGLKMESMKIAESKSYETQVNAAHNAGTEKIISVDEAEKEFLSALFLTKDELVLTPDMSIDKLKAVLARKVPMNVRAAVLVDLADCLPFEDMEQFKISDCPTQDSLKIISWIRTPTSKPEYASDPRKGSENDAHVFVSKYFNEVITAALQAHPTFGNDFRPCRDKTKFGNSSSSTVGDGSRPDFRIDYGPAKIVVFRGEEKASSATDTLEDAVAEMEDPKRTYWDASVNGDAPFFLCYAMKGLRVQVLRMKWKDTCFRDVVCEKCCEFDLGSASGRLEAINVALNIARVIAALVPLLAKNPSKGLKLTSTLNGKQGTTMKNISDDNIIFKDVSALYTILQESPFLLIVQGNISSFLNTFSITTAPIGHPRLPQPVELPHFVQCASAALKNLHQLGYVHRDVRLPNFVRLSDGNWMLIDLEYAAQLQPDRAPWPTFIKKEFQPLRNENELWRPKHDFWQLANTLKQEFIGNAEYSAQEQAQAHLAFKNLCTEHAFKEEEFLLHKTPST